MSAKKVLRGASPCPCQSGSSYGNCCRPLHAGQHPAPSAEALMRSRYSAFSAGLVGYLVDTLHPDHPDASQPREALLASLQATCRSYRYTGLSVIRCETEGDLAWVTFRARVFEKGRDLSFAERSRFERTKDGWRYRTAESIGPTGADVEPEPRDC